MRVILIRHTSVDVPKGICYGHTDVPLASSFAIEAQIVKERIKTYHFDKVYCSPLSRCVELARFCGYEDAERDDRLKEMDFGDWEMKAYNDIHDPRLQDWFNDYITIAPTGGESVLDQRSRFESFINEKKEEYSNSLIGIFTHGGILINALVSYSNMSYEEVYNSKPTYGAIIEIEV
ncbi:MAG: alpha-ribazole phosphatase [Muribaculaceae bacterium]|nr:alpha-ribazole phosphatase [Muribaculaceae bacterium]MDE7109509.1 alpha-ribazole phosphatase [Muribaculaceae bacterium]